MVCELCLTTSGVDGQGTILVQNASEKGGCGVRVEGGWEGGGAFTDRLAY